MSRAACLAAVLCLVLAGGDVVAQSDMDFMETVDFAKRYAAAWSSQDSQLLASFYAKDGRLVVNDGEPAVGRAAIAEKARGFMEAFPDMKVEMVAVQGDGDGAEFHWRWTGTNTGPGGTGLRVDLRGVENWTFSADNLILVSDGHYDKGQYEAQVNPAQ